MPKLFIDLATSGAFDFHNEDPLSTSQAHMIRLAALLTTDAGNTLSETCCLIKRPAAAPPIEPGAQGFNGISEDMLQERGVSMHSALAEFGVALAQTTLIVAHGWQFPRKVLEWTYAYYGHPDRTWPESFDTMLKGTEYVGIVDQKPSKKPRYKWPSFNEMHEKVTGFPWRLSADPALGDAERRIFDGLARVRMVRLAHYLLTRETMPQAQG
jgi:hypothetical protein